MTDKSYPTPLCVFCGAPTNLIVRNDYDNGLYVAAVMCLHCDSGMQMGLNLDDVKQRAVEAYQRATEVRDRLRTACQRLLDAEREASDEMNYQGLVEATELARDAIQRFTLTGERRLG